MKHKYELIAIYLVLLGLSIASTAEIIRVISSPGLIDLASATAHLIGGIFWASTVAIFVTNLYLKKRHENRALRFPTEFVLMLWLSLVLNSLLSSLQSFLR